LGCLKGGENVNKKVAASVIAIIVVAVAVGGFYIYSEIQKRQALKNVEVSISDIEVVDVGITAAKLNVKLQLHNPNTVTATLDRADYTLYGNDIYVGNGEITEKVDIPAGATRTVTSPFDLSYSGAVQSVWTYIVSGGKITWRVIGTAYIDTPLGTLTVPFNCTISK
jgi:LEA14-like dessication related protein